MEAQTGRPHIGLGILIWRSMIEATVAEAVGLEDETTDATRRSHTARRHLQRLPPLQLFNDRRALPPRPWVPRPRQSPRRPKRARPLPFGLVTTTLSLPMSASVDGQQLAARR